ncbi:hypothetical protein AQUCO_02000293v1 [Aquilegia coerulea]|uniref:Protein cereblon n=1 Tax=Aquilegia coerulea TaxID=218851 RepID=A0A2G5DGU9_AQUCA|nr:hypothetical protein AQUCO_02000293v1 [Aquilegia coerulea]
MEELEVEEVDYFTSFSNSSSSSDNDNDDSIEPGNNGGGGRSNGVTFDMCLTSLHSYLGEIDDTNHRVAVFDGGTILSLPIFYLEGVVLFPEATLPLRVIHSRCKAAVERAINQVEAPYTIGVIRVHKHPNDGRLCVARVGTTAEIRQYKKLDDGSVNIVTRGQQRFNLKRSWMDVEGAPCAEVQIIQEDLPVRTPRDAFGQLASVSNLWRRSLSSSLPSNSSRAQQHFDRGEESDSDSMSQKSLVSEHSSAEFRLHESPTYSGSGYDMTGQLTDSDEEFVLESGYKLGRSHADDSEKSSPHNIYTKGIETDTDLGIGKQLPLGRPISKGEGQNCLATSGSGYRAPRSFWPHWVYRMFDSYCLAQKAADKWKQTVGTPSMDDLVNKPDLLSFYIASKIPVSESTRQELLEIDGISYRLRREIELLECFDRVRCKTCQTIIAKRSDMLVMSSDGPLGAFVNPHGYVHEIMTLYKANGLALIGNPDKQYSWFPGYAWTITICTTCESQLGWLFTATKRKLKPRSFWGIRSSQVADDLST